MHMWVNCKGGPSPRLCSEAKGVGLAAAPQRVRGVDFAAAHLRDKASGEGASRKK